MGMYDTFNDGYQEKVFLWYTYDNFFKEELGTVSAHGGGLKYFGSGSAVPYRSLSRNYTKNFVILDNDGEDIPVIVLHIIEDGILVDTIELNYTNKSKADAYLSKTNLVISGHADLLNNIHSVDDIKAYINDSENKINQLLEINSKYNFITNESIKILRKIIESKKGKKEEVEELKKLYKENEEKKKKEFEKISPKIKKINENFRQKWIYSNPEYLEYETFGAWIESGLFYMKMFERYQNNKEEIQKYEKEMNCYKRDFLKIFNEKLKSEDFLKGYFEWCEATEEEKNNVKRLFEEIAVNARL